MLSLWLKRDESYLVEYLYAVIFEDISKLPQRLQLNYLCPTEKKQFEIQ